MRSLALRFLWLSLITSLLGLAACSSSTDPGPAPGDITLQYTPAQGLLHLAIGDTARFSVASSPAVDLDLSWIWKGDLAGDQAAFQVEASPVGVDTLQLLVGFSGVHWSRTWYLDVQQDPSTAPPVVVGVSLGDGPEPADVRVGWLGVGDSTYPVVDYLVAMSYGGPVTDANWDAALPLGTFAADAGQVGYSEMFTTADGMVSGETAWFAVRARDQRGQMSTVSEPHQHLISSAWWIEGYVYDDDFNPLPNVIIDYGCPTCRVNTDVTGFYSIGPLPNVNNYDLTTFSRNTDLPGQPFSSWYDFTRRDVHYQPEDNYDLMIVTRYGLDATCDSYNLDFLFFFEKLTRTLFPTDLRQNRKLFKWEQYPVPVYVPPFTNGNGLDYQALCREVVGFWNIAMDEDYLYLVDSPAEARIEFYFGNEGTAYAGRVVLVLPDDQAYALGDVIPEQINVYIWDQLTQAIQVQETAMHELGHALGLHEHVTCSGEGFLMNVNPSGILAHGPQNAVHPDEKRAIRAIRNLPQGVDMSDFADR